MPTPSQTDLHDQRSEAEATALTSRWPNETYEAGVANTIAWILGERDAPMDD